MWTTNSDKIFSSVVIMLFLLFVSIAVCKVSNPIEKTEIVNTIELISDKNNTYKISAKSGKAYILRVDDWSITYYKEGDQFTITTVDKVTYLNYFIGKKTVNTVSKICFAEECHIQREIVPWHVLTGFERKLLEDAQVSNVGQYTFVYSGTEKMRLGFKRKISTTYDKVEVLKYTLLSTGTLTLVCFDDTFCLMKS